MLAAGRVPNIEGLGLDAAGVHVDNGRIVVDDVLATTNPRIHVIGDVAGTLSVHARRRASCRASCCARRCSG